MAKRAETTPKTEPQEEIKEVFKQADEAFNSLPKTDPDPVSLIEKSLEHPEADKPTFLKHILIEVARILKSTPKTPTTVVTINPSEATVAQGSTVKFEANVPVVWTLEGFAGGTIYPDGAYVSASVKKSAGTVPNVDILTATSVDGSGAKAQVTITVV